MPSSFDILSSHSINQRRAPAIGWYENTHTLRSHRIWLIPIHRWESLSFLCSPNAIILINDISGSPTWWSSRKAGLVAVIISVNDIELLCRGRSDHRFTWMIILPHSPLPFCSSLSPSYPSFISSFIDYAFSCVCGSPCDWEVCVCSSVWVYFTSGLHMRNGAPAETARGSKHYKCNSYDAAAGCYFCLSAKDDVTRSMTSQSYLGLRAVKDGPLFRAERISPYARRTPFVWRGNSSRRIYELRVRRTQQPCEIFSSNRRTGECRCFYFKV